MFNPSDYTVGWICAITTEYVAAQSLLDEKHGKPEYVSLFDTNDYILGKMSNHNVVITVLPGEHGTDSAATAATNMLHSFPNVRFGLMVGTGGGAPGPKQDIRLGDVVVSTPCNGFGGVYQYDYGKAIQGQSFKPTRFLNQPPVVLRAAINGIQARYERKGHRLEETIDKVLEKHKRMRQKYKRPPYDHDRLYESQTVHPLDTEASCAEKCDSAKLILRPPRTEYEGNPMIHYGLIASGNQLMNDALARDKFVAEDGVLCFEMEAAGLMNMFPCLVVRGICNYSDSHGTKEWQGYAAMTAAAYAKDLLRQIIPSKMETEAKLKKDISGIHESVQDLSQQVSRLMSKMNNQERQDILGWLSGSRYSFQQNDVIANHKEAPEKWFLESKEFQEWHAGQEKILFCPVGPGAGMDLIASHVVDYLLQSYGDDLTFGTAFVRRSSQRQHNSDQSTFYQVY